MHTVLLFFAYACGQQSECLMGEPQRWIARSMPFERNDVLIAFKHIGISEQLNGTEKQLAVFLVDSYNRKTGRCDPSEETAAHILGRSTRTIISAGHRLVQLNLFRKRKHGGNNHCNSYEPVWEAFRELERVYKLRRKRWAGRFARTELSPSMCQPCHSETDSQVRSKCQVGHPHADSVGTQTSSFNQIEPTCPTNNISSTLPTGLHNKHRALGNGGRLCKEGFDPDASNRSRGLERTNSARAAAEAAALRRWSDDLLAEFPLIAAYGAVVDAIDLPMQDTATAAEMKRRGGGLAYIVSELSGREVLQNAGSRPEGSQDSKA
jgi:hypothetical protein